MSIKIHAIIEDGGIVLPKGVDIPDGTLVEIRQRDPDKRKSQRRPSWNLGLKGHVIRADCYDD
ncbi:MAG: hypothetical protein CMI52_01745 [Parcubacteria group bacterium]|nr:hypothetical protein [Parcubacteria group bacterium]